MKPKNKNIEIGNILSEHKFISQTKYWRIDKAIFDGIEFKVGTRVCWVDPDEEKHVEYNGNIDWLMIDEYGNVEVSIDNLMVGRLDLEDLIYIDVN
jgi:hypothetical protein